MFSEGRGSLQWQTPFCPEGECAPHYKLYFLTELHWQRVCRVLLNLWHESADCVLRDLRSILGAACVTRWGREPGDTPRHLDSIPAPLSLSDRPSEHSCVFRKNPEQPHPPDSNNTASLSLSVCSQYTDRLSTHWPLHRVMWMHLSQYVGNKIEQIFSAPLYLGWG